MDDAAGLDAEALQCGAGVLDRAVETFDSHLAVTVDAQVDRPETTRADLPLQMHLRHTTSQWRRPRGRQGGPSPPKKNLGGGQRRYYPSKI